MCKQSAGKRRSAFTLLLTVLLIGLLVAITGQLTSQIGVQAVITLREAGTPKHELAVDSILLAVTDGMYADGGGSDIPLELDRHGSAEVRLELGDVEISCVIADDAARFNPRFFQGDRHQPILIRKLERLRDRMGLPHIDIKLRPVITANANDETGGRFRWYDQLLSDVTPGTIFGLGDPSRIQEPEWSKAVTFWGDGRVGLRRVSEPVLEAALDDLEPGLARRMLARRPNDRSVDFNAAVMTAVPAELRQDVSQRVAYDPKRYAMEIVTHVSGERRRWYVVARIHGGELEALHRSQITW